MILLPKQEQSETTDGNLRTCVGGPTITWKPWLRNATSLGRGPKKDYVPPHLRCLERQNQFGEYFILKSLELGPSFRSAVPRFPVDDPHYRILARQRSRYTHSYFCTRDEVWGRSA